MAQKTPTEMAQEKKSSATPLHQGNITALFTARQRKLLAMSQVILELYNRILPQIGGHENTAIRATWRLLLNSDEYAWFRRQYPEYPRTCMTVARIVRRKNAIQVKAEAYGRIMQGDYEKADA